MWCNVKDNTNVTSGHDFNIQTTITVTYKVPCIAHDQFWFMWPQKHCTSSMKQNIIISYKVNRNILRYKYQHYRWSELCYHNLDTFFVELPTSFLKNSTKTNQPVDLFRSGIFSRHWDHGSLALRISQPPIRGDGCDWEWVTAVSSSVDRVWSCSYKDQAEYVGHTLHVSPVGFGVFSFLLMPSFVCLQMVMNGLWSWLKIKGYLVRDCIW